MGLCKCPKKKVTNQFCFEHRVNVCEHCMVTNHSKCVVQSYIQWLQDSDYNPNCHICKTELAEGDCIRLTCYHVFHWDCLNKCALSVSPQTPPEGYTCPVCNVCIFPQPNAVSPVTESLRNALLGVNWARIGLGYPPMENNLLDENSHQNNVHFSPLQAPSSPVKSAAKPAPITINSSANQMEMNNIRPEPYGASYTTSYTSPRKLYDATEHGHHRPLIADHDEDKYKRRSALEWFGRWFKSRTATHGRGYKRDPNVIYKKWMIILVLCLIALCTLCILFLKLGRSSADSDPLLDPRFNPNIRVADNVEDIHSKSKFAEKNIVADNLKELLPA